MNTQKIRVIKKMFVNKVNGEIVTNVIELTKEGSNKEAILYRCVSCNTLFHISLEKLTYENNDILAVTRDKTCPTCNAFLHDTIQKSANYSSPYRQLDMAEYKLIEEKCGVFQVIDVYDLAS